MNPHLSIQHPRGAFAGSMNTGWEGRGFSRFPPLAVGQGESQQPTDSPNSSHDVDLSNFGEVRNSGPAYERRPFPFALLSLGNHLPLLIFRKCIVALRFSRIG
jgi:hypothetical protein